MTKPIYDLILGCNNMEELHIVLDFWTKEITIDETTLPMRDINSPIKSKKERTWAINNRMACGPSSLQEVTQRVVHVLDAKYEKADLQSVVSTNFTHQSLYDQN
jgi:hypothetical protein